MAMLSLLTTAYAEHFKFLGIPIDGDVATFEKALLAKGFTLDGKSNSAVEKYYKGKFLGNKVSLYVKIASKSHVVSSVSVVYEKKKSMSWIAEESKRLDNLIKSEYTINDVDEYGDFTIYYVDNCGKLYVFQLPDRIMLKYVDIENHKLLESEKHNGI